MNKFLTTLISGIFSGTMSEVGEGSGSMLMLSYVTVPLVLCTLARHVILIAKRWLLSTARGPKSQNDHYQLAWAKRTGQTRK